MTGAFVMRLVSYKSLSSCEATSGKGPATKKKKQCDDEALDEICKVRVSSPFSSNLGQSRDSLTSKLLSLTLTFTFPSRNIEFDRFVFQSSSQPQPSKSMLDHNTQTTKKHGLNHPPRKFKRRPTRRDGFNTKTIE